ncbi:hypothetical protein D3C85_1119340 [compost metagenome]
MAVIQLLRVERVKRLAVLQHHEVRDVDDVVNGADARSHQAVLDPQRGSTYAHAFDQASRVVRALLRRCDLHADAVRGFHAGRACRLQRSFRIRQLYLAAKDRRDLVSRSEHAQAIGAVWRQI